MFFLSIDLMCRGTIGAAENGECRVVVRWRKMTYSRPPKTKWVQGYLYESFSAGVAAKTSYKALLRAVLFDLPNELILHIVSYIKDHSTLHSLSFVSIIFNKISTASLYHTYRNRESLLDDLSLRSFLRLILTNSRLASLVKKVDLGSWQTRFDVKSLGFYNPL